MDKCPYCGSDNGVYTTYTGRQFYYWDGEPCGYDSDVLENQIKFARCVKCNRKISLKRLKNNGKINISYID